MKPFPCAGVMKSLSLMGGGPLNTSILKTYRLGGCGLILLIEPPQGGQPTSLRGWNKMFWIRKPTSRCLAATPGKNTEQSHALVTKRPESLLHFQASSFGRLYALVGPKLSTPRFIASAPSLSDEAGIRLAHLNSPKDDASRPLDRH
jgi:hypothetical protein